MIILTGMSLKFLTLAIEINIIMFTLTENVYEGNMQSTKNLSSDLFGFTWKINFFIFFLIYKSLHHL